MNRVLKYLARASDFCSSANSLDLRTGRHYSDADMARQAQRREDREVATDMRAERLRLTDRLDRVRELRTLTAEFRGNEVARNTPGCSDPGYRRFVGRAIGRDIRALGVAQ